MNFFIAVFIIFKVTITFTRGQPTTKPYNSGAIEKVKDQRFDALAQCHVINGTDEATKKPCGIEFRLPHGRGNCDDGFWICYQPVLQRGRNLDTSTNYKAKRTFAIDTEKEHSITKECAQRMPKDSGKSGTMLWRGIKLRTVPMPSDKNKGKHSSSSTDNDDEVTILETTFNDSLKIYNFGTTQRQFLMPLFGGDERSLQNDFLRHLSSKAGAAFLADYAALWLLGLDMPPMAHHQTNKQQQMNKLFLSRGSDCTMDARFIMPSNSNGPTYLEIPCVGSVSCPPKQTNNVFSAKFTNTGQQMIIIKALTDANIKSVKVELLSGKKDDATKTEVSFKIGTDIDFEVELPGSSKLIRSKGMRLARGSYVLNLEIVLLKRCYMIRLNGTQFGGLSCQAAHINPSPGQNFSLETINRIKVQGQMLLFADPLVKQIDDKTFVSNEENSKFSSGIINTESDECFGENMVYTLKMNDSRTIRGKKFNCSFAWLLEKYKLSDKFSIKENIEVKYPGHPKFVFVTAANDAYFKTLRVLIATIKQRFGCKEKIIAYDLGNITQNKSMMAELNSVCKLTWRTFNFSQMDVGRVRQLSSYAFKLFVIADVFLEHDTVFWVDTSIVFHNNNTKPILASIQTGKIGPVQMPSSTWHGTNFATHPGMYEYLPLFANFEIANGEDPKQFEANFVILHKTEQTRQFMKWCGILKWK
ncbi:hypothetical protein niasHS_004941 [Heterodera schachtii]|uniref:Uncharacterized protein n=1 Tax=Heterodera schachtii TaxID=97005 RepID=A0ABD2K0C8_HETSC